MYVPWKVYIKVERDMVTWGSGNGNSILMIYIYMIYIYMCDMYTYTWWNNQWIVDESDWDQVFHALSTLWWTSHLTETRESRTWTRSTNRRSQLKMVIAAGKNLCWFRRPAQHCRNNTRLCQKLIKSCSAKVPSMLSSAPRCLLPTLVCHCSHASVPCAPSSDQRMRSLPG